MPSENHPHAAESPRVLQMATIGKRFVALLVDQMILLIPALALMLAIAVPNGLFKEAGAADPSPAFLMFQVLFSLAWMGFGIAYEGTMLASGGQTVGKKLLRIKVVTPEGNDITSGQAWTRAAVRHVMSAVLCLGFVDYLVGLGQERTCIHDQAARTRVVNWDV